MAYDAYQRVIEFHKKAAHLHEAAAASHDKGDYLTAHELTKQALEYSREALKHSESAAEHHKGGKGSGPDRD